MSGTSKEALDRVITDTLGMMGVDPDTLDGRTMDQLRKIESAITDEIESRRNAEKEVRRHNLSVISITKVCDVSYATFYNKRLLADYVNKRRDDEAGRSGARVSAALRERVSELEAMLDAADEQAALMVQLETENRKLKQRVRMLEVQLQGGQPAMDGKGEVLPLRPVKS